MGQDLADVVAAGTQDGKEGVADGAFQGAARQAAVGLHVADFGFDGAASAKVRDQPWRQAAAGAADQNAGFVLAMAAVSTVYDGQIGALVGQGCNLFEGLFQGVAVVGIARKAAHADHEALVQRGGDADLAAELIADACLAL